MKSENEAELKRTEEFSFDQERWLPSLSVIALVALPFCAVGVSSAVVR